MGWMIEVRWSIGCLMWASISVPPQDKVSGLTSCPVRTEVSGR